MPKLSVSVPEDLWDAAQRRSGGEMKTSQLVQQALQLYIDSGRRRPAPTIADDEGRFEEVVQALVGSHQVEFRRGYNAGLEAAEILDFTAHELIRGDEKNFNLVFTPYALYDSEPEQEVFWPKRNAYSDADEWEAALATLAEVRTDLQASAVFRDGVLQAFIDVWAAVEERVAGERDDEDDLDFSDDDV